jgi:hypothetical protein
MINTEQQWALGSTQILPVSNISFQYPKFRAVGDLLRVCLSFNCHYSDYRTVCDLPRNCLSQKYHHSEIYRAVCDD